MELIHPTAVIADGVDIGENVTIGPYAVIGYPGQGRYPKEKPTGRVVIGDNVVVHELAVIQSGIENTTVIGHDAIVMCQSHIAHDCVLGAWSVLSPACVLSGHTLVGDYATVGIAASTHQYAQLGTGSFLAGNGFLKGVTGPWEVWAGTPARFLKQNETGWERYQNGYYK